MLAEPVMGDLLDHAEGGAANLDEWQRANLREMRRLWVHATALDAKLVEALSKACSASEQVWRDARPKGDFAMQLPALTEVLRLTREAAAAKSARLGVGAYDALLDEYEPGGRSADIDLVFDDLAAFLPGLLARVLEHQARQPAPLRSARSLPGGEAARSRPSGSCAPWASTSSMAASTPACIPSAAACPTMCASPPATTRTISPAPSWA